VTADLAAVKWAAAYLADQFICVQTYSSRRAAAADPLGRVIILHPQCSNQELGQALEEALAASRQLTMEEADRLFEPRSLEQRYEEWVDSIMKRFAYKSRGHLFAGMKRCTVDLKDGLITIRPNCHHKLESWSGTGIKKESYVTVPAAAKSEDIGAGLREAFARCTEG
jgi:hypothetical protein